MNKGKRALTKTVLSTLARMVAKSFTLSFDFYRFRSAYLKGGHSYAMQVKRGISEAETRKAIRDLAKGKFIKAQKRGGKLMLSLTDKGLFYLLRQELLLADKTTDAGTLVVFDIPESERLGRDKFRRWLKDSEFEMIQRSVWFTPRNVAKPLQSLVKKIKLFAWIRIFTIKP